MGFFHLQDKSRYGNYTWGDSIPDPAADRPAVNKT